MENDSLMLTSLEPDLDERNYKACAVFWYTSLKAFWATEFLINVDINRDKCA